jgi:hypothetical protein
MHEMATKPQITGQDELCASLKAELKRLQRQVRIAKSKAERSSLRERIGILDTQIKEECGGLRVRSKR